MHSGVLNVGGPRGPGEKAARPASGPERGRNHAEVDEKWRKGMIVLYGMCSMY